LKPKIQQNQKDMALGEALLIQFKQMSHFLHQRDKIHKNQFDRRVLGIKKWVPAFAGMTIRRRRSGDG